MTILFINCAGVLFPGRIQAKLTQVNYAWKDLRIDMKSKTKKIISQKGVKTIDGFNGQVDFMILELISLALFLKLGSLEYRFLKHKNIFPICH